MPLNEHIFDAGIQFQIAGTTLENFEAVLASSKGRYYRTAILHGAAKNGDFYFYMSPCINCRPIQAVVTTRLDGLWVSTAYHPNAIEDKDRYKKKVIKINRKAEKRWKD